MTDDDTAGADGAPIIARLARSISSLPRRKTNDNLQRKKQRDEIRADAATIGLLVKPIFFFGTRFEEKTQRGLRIVEEVIGIECRSFEILLAVDLLWQELKISDYDGVFIQPVLDTC